MKKVVKKVVIILIIIEIEILDLTTYDNNPTIPDAIDPLTGRSLGNEK